MQHPIRNPAANGSHHNPPIADRMRTHIKINAINTIVDALRCFGILLTISTHWNIRRRPSLLFLRITPGPCPLIDISHLVIVLFSSFYLFVAGLSPRLINYLIICSHFSCACYEDNALSMGHLRSSCFSVRPDIWTHGQPHYCMDVGND